MRTNYWVMVLTLGMIRVEACGPDFSVMLTRCRESCLQQIKTPGFANDVQRLRTTSGPPAMEDPSGGRNQVGFFVDNHETQPGFPQKLSQMRQAPTGDEAYRLGEGLPEAMRLYTAGAVEFNKVHHAVLRDGNEDEAEDSVPADEVNKGLTAAIGWFERVVALPPDPHDPRFVLATYMLARSHFLRGHDGDEDIAVTEYRTTIKLVADGAPDPVGLGNAALGELGRIAMSHDRTSEAIGLYSEQITGFQAEHALESLWMVLGVIASDDTKLEREIRVPLSQKALTAFALSNLDNTCRDVGDEDCGDGSFAYHSLKRDAAQRIAAALAELNPKDIQWPDEAAAVTYRVGDFEATAKLLKRSDTPYAQWLRAKVALHAGDMETAAKAFAAASKAFATESQSKRPTQEYNPWNTDRGSLAGRVIAESGVLSLSRSDYTEALYQLTMSKDFDQDARYVAEQVLTVDELKGLVDKEDWAAPYRDLLARRLMRAQRVDEAVKYYTDKVATEAAPRYAAAWLEATTAPDNWKQAQGWYEVAKLEVQSGMELSGTEGCPDEHEDDGGFECNAASIADGSLGSDDERHRNALSVPSPNVRFHYRTVGVDHLFKAADRLPRKSEVLSAVLCNGANWLRRHSYNEDLIQTVYRRYVKDGRRETWAENFGSKCPEPRFAP